MSGGGADLVEGEGWEVQRGAGAAVAGPVRDLLGSRLGRLLRGDGVHDKGVVYLQGMKYEMSCSLVLAWNKQLHTKTQFTNTNNVICWRFEM